MSSLSKPTRESIHPSIPRPGGFNQLPNELLLEIARSLSRACDLYALRRVNKRLAALFENHLSDILLRAYQPSSTRHRLFSDSTRYAESLVVHLVRLGIDLNAVHRGFWPVLHIAILHSNESMVRSLLRHGARINVPEHIYRDNAVHVAIQATNRNSPASKEPREVDLAILRMLLDNGGLQTMNDQASLNSDGVSWLNLAVRSCPRKNMTVVKLFLVPGLSLDVPDKEGNRTPLHVAVWHQKVDLVTALLDLGADHRTVDSHGQSPFAMACNRPTSELVDLLLRHDVALFDEVVGEQGETAELCMQRSLEMWIACEDRFKGGQKRYYGEELVRRTQLVGKLKMLAEARGDSVISDSDLQIYYNSL